MAVKQVSFIVIILIASGIFTFTISRLVGFFKLTKPAYRITDISRRIKILLSVAFGQTKILRRPVVGIMHALVYWGFMVITVGTVEMIIDGVLDTERVLSDTGFFYTLITASGDILAVMIIGSCLVFLFRRHFIKVKRFNGIEMTKGSTIDATIALLMILLLMVSLIGTNVGYLAQNPNGYAGMFPMSTLLVAFVAPKDLDSLYLFTEVNWWAHVMLVFIFANALPYSKHFHVFMSMPNVFLTRLEPLTKLSNMTSVTNEVKAMMNPETAFAPQTEGIPGPSRFGVKDAEDVTWKNYLDSLTCTECGRCTSVCPANITGKKLSPRKIFVDLRKRMSEKGPGLIKEGIGFSDSKSLLGDYISAEELWACTTCNACAMECPVNIDHPSLIIDMRRYLVLEESAAPADLNNMFANIENNGAPWPFPQSARLDWAQSIEMKS
ncbi:MAG: 4Fe-4S dicluster domain-containing protein [Bacteroidetes bacterium]|nr:4Fe-4S dicluster domain-containing protein [Bacteroidota bacterium]MDA1118876.1 4Fe-4S dicluster domain-containing protein [Bacteroidota bacterium]